MSKRSEPAAPKTYLGDWLEELGVKVIDAAKMAGCSQGYLSNIIRGDKKRPNVLYLLQLSNRLGLTINDFYEPVPPPEQIARVANISPRARETLLERRRRAG